MDPNATTAEIEARRLAKQMQQPLPMIHGGLTRVMQVLACRPAAAAEIMLQAHFMEVARPSAQRIGPNAAVAQVMAQRFPLFMPTEKELPAITIPRVRR